jgi:hypothetical protein
MSCKNKNTIWVLVNPEDKDGTIVVGKTAIINYLKEYVRDVELSRNEVYDMIDNDNLVIYEVPAPLVVIEGVYTINNFIGDLLWSIMKRPSPEYEVPADVFLALIE